MASKSSQKLVDKGWDRIQRATAKLSSLYADVGIQSDAGTDNEGNPIIVRAMANEFGAKNIPERSFVRSAFDEQAEALKRLKARLWRGVIDNKISPEMAAGFIGQQHETDIKNKIRNGPFVANSEATVERKGSSKPLIDTGQMLNSVRYVVGEK